MPTPHIVWIDVLENFENWTLTVGVNNQYSFIPVLFTYLLFFLILLILFELKFGVLERYVTSFFWGVGTFSQNNVIDFFFLVLLELKKEDIAQYPPQDKKGHVPTKCVLHFFGGVAYVPTGHTQVPFTGATYITLRNISPFFVSMSEKGFSRMAEQSKCQRRTKRRKGTTKKRVASRWENAFFSHPASSTLYPHLEWCHFPHHLMSSVTEWG